ncbi:MAG TPA: 1,4-dihydroxy-2-naphthoate polyprenyltransferase, partial [Sporichthya sp.]|nr:1,4-dihydroxy-2-naphthoate polyprenyltransferase [Sporichthya sp.]
MATPAQWLAGARPRTLPAAIVPVAVGTGVAVEADHAVWWKALLALIVSLAMQVGVNYANDYSDGVRGTDDVRVGPLRLVGSKVAAPEQVKLAAFAALGVGAAAGLVLAATTSWWLLAVGVAAMAAAWGYTGGATPYGYKALGELSVFVFFGLVAVIGTAYVQTEEVTGLAVAASIPVGMLACALLVVNNLRDAPVDAGVGKNTLAVVLGDGRTRWLYTVLMFGPLLFALGLAVAHPWTVIAVLALPVAAPAVRA